MDVKDCLVFCKGRSPNVSLKYLPFLFTLSLAKTYKLSLSFTEQLRQRTENIITIKLIVYNSDNDSSNKQH